MRYNANMNNSLSLKALVDQLANNRKEQSLTQAELASLLNLPQSYVAKIESGKTDLRTTKLIEIARVLGLEVMLIPKDHLYLVNQVLTEDDIELEKQQKRTSMYEPDELEDE